MFHQSKLLLNLFELKGPSFLRKIHFCSSLRNLESSLALDREEPNKWQSVVGLEIHAQINANSKLFSGSSTIFGSPTNTQVSYFDASLPGTLPILNRYCVESAVRTALALNCTVNKKSTFDRKHYFYADMPAGYQITQQFQPIATDGYLEFLVTDHHSRFKPYLTKAKLKQIQLEQDSGKSFHFDNLKTLVDLNRAGVGLLELVFDPDLKNGAEAASMVKELQLILTKLGICTCAMEEGTFRVDANISVHKVGESWGVRTEVKNINSNTFIAKAIDYEIQRQIEVIEKGGLISNETRSYDYKAKKTVFMRDKEKFQDYRFMPEPNLPAIQLCDNTDENLINSLHFVNVDEMKNQIPQLPSEIRKEMMEKYNLTYVQVDRIVKQAGLREFFESVLVPGMSPSFVFSFLIHWVAHHLNNNNQDFQTCDVSHDQIKDVLSSLHNRDISQRTSQDILGLYFNGDTRSVKEIVDTYNWSLITDEKEIEILCQKVIGENKKSAKKYRNTKRRIHLNGLIHQLNDDTNKRVALADAETMFNKLLGIQTVETTKNDENIEL